MAPIVQIRDVSRDLEQVRRLHAFLMPHFGETELEPLSYYESTARETGPVTMIMMSGEVDGVLRCGAIAELIALPGEGRVLAAIGHALVSPAARGLGLGRRIADATDAALAHHARQQGLTIEAFILESEAGARKFWSRLGYRWPDQMRFWQPPLAYKPDGTPALPHIPLFLMVRHPNHPDTIPTALVQEYTAVLMHEWYQSEIDEQVADPSARHRAHQWFQETLFQPTLNSISTDTVPLVDLQSLSDEQADDWLR